MRLNYLSIDVPIIKDSFSINFGGLLELWTGGKIRATKHRVIGRGESRFSVPFFFEPRPNTVIKPLPIDGIRKFKPFFYGDHLWATTTKFPENFGLLSLRPHQGNMKILIKIFHLLKYNKLADLILKR